MNDTQKVAETRNPWRAYVPSAECPWDLRRVVHLHRRAGFAATWNEIQRDLKDGPKASIDRLLAGTARSEGVPDEFERTAGRVLGTARDLGRLQAWWVYRMLFGPDPLGERLVLMWHNHFATSAQKVRDAGLMQRQNELFPHSAASRLVSCWTRSSTTRPCCFGSTRLPIARNTRTRTWPASLWSSLHSALGITPRRTLRKAPRTHGLDGC